jgi:AcrR family transcriptional regulator
VTLVGKPRGEYAKTARRRQDLIQAAMDVFAESGYKGGSIRDVATRVGISQAGLLHHFSSKHELLAAVLTRRDEIANEMIAVEVDGVPRLPTGIALLRAIAGMPASNSLTRGLVSLFTVLGAEATSPDHDAHEYFRGRYVTTRGDLARMFREVAAEGHLRPEVDPDRAARTMIALMDGFQVQWLLDEEALDMAADLRAYVQSLLTVPL